MKQMQSLIGLDIVLKHQHPKTADKIFITHEKAKLSGRERWQGRRDTCHGKSARHFWGRTSANALLCLSLQGHVVSPTAGCCIVTSHALAQCGMLLGMCWKSRTVFLLQDACGHSYPQGTCFISSTCHSSESLQQKIKWFLYFASAFCLFPQGSQVSIENLAMGS